MDNGSEYKSDGGKEEDYKAVLAVERGADGQPVQKNLRIGQPMQVEYLLNPQIDAQTETVESRRPKKKKVAKEAPKESKATHH